MSLFISITTASSDSTDSAINKAITRLAAKAAGEKKNKNLPQGPSLAVTFMLPGKLDKPDFKGMRMGGYRTDDNTLYFESSVPEHIIHSQKADEYVEMVMQDVVINATAFFSEYQVDFDAVGWQKCVARIAQSDTTPQGLH